MIKKFSEEASINNLGSVQYDRSQKYMTQKDKDQACENIGLGSSIAKNLEEVVFANIPIDSSTLRFSFGDLNYDPTTDTAVASAHNTTDRAGGGTPKGYGGTWKKLNTYYTNIWDYTYVDDTLLNEFDNGNINATTATRFWDDVEKNPIKIIASNTAGCENFRRAFEGVLALTEVWTLDTSDATNVRSMFTYCRSLRRVPKVLDFSSATNFGLLFQFCFNLEEINQIILPDGESTYSMESLFSCCQSLKSINKPLNCKCVSTLSGWFGGCVSLSHVILENTNNVTSLDHTFSACKSLPMSVFNSLDTSAVTNYNCTLYGEFIFKNGGVQYFEVQTDMENVVEIPNFDLTNATRCTFMLGKCKNIRYIDASKFSTLKTSCNISDLFIDCENVETGMLAAYNILLTRSPSSYNNCFTNCGINTESGRTERKYIPTSWGGDME